VSFGFLGFVDVNGSLRGKAYASDEFDAICARGHVACTDVLLAVDPLDQPITTLETVGARAGAGDLRLCPVGETIRPSPWRPGSTIAIADVAWIDGSPCELSTRQVLANALARVADRGLRAMAAFEYEVRLWSAEDGTPVSSAQSYSVRGVESSAEFADRLQEAAEALGLGLTAVHTEGGPGLIEINCRAFDAQTAADNAVILRLAVHEVARRCGLRASFLAKPIVGEEGSSGHVHVSLWKGEDNALAATADANLAVAMRHAIGGVMRHLPAMSLAMNPTINSYKRLVPGFFAPVNASWGVENRSAAVRVVGPREEHARIEVRRPGADANPYLVLAAIVASMAEGLEAAIEPPAAFAGDAYAATAETCPPLPGSLESAITAFAADARAQELLGRSFADYFIATRAWELRAWQHAVTEWEHERYGLIT
jgi:glutamine synthetase